MSRISLTGVEPSLVQAALGQLVQLFCADDTSLDPHTRWQKDGQPISSDRCVWESSPGGSPSDFSWAGKVSVGLVARPPGALGPEGGWVHYGSQEPRAQAPPPHSGTGCSLMAPWSSAPCGQRMLAPTAVAAPGWTVTLRRSSFALQVSVPHLQWVLIGSRKGGVGWKGLGTPTLEGLGSFLGPRHPGGRDRMYQLGLVDVLPLVASFLHTSPAGLMAHPSFHPLLPTAHLLLLLAS